MCPSALLSVERLSKRFGAFAALDGLSLELAPGEILGLVGPNGSGKTTAINVISGVYTADSGTIRLEGRPVGNLPIHRRTRLGINRTFQVPKPFKALTVAENLEVAAVHSNAGREDIARHLDLLDLSPLADRQALTLNSAQQKRLDLARAMITRPRLLLVDELGAGLNPAELTRMAQMLQEIARSGVALLVVEHLLGFLRVLTSRVVVMDAGREIFEGSLEAAAKDSRVIDVFFGH
ncbi:MAG: ABC transporter ATP-binding protein [Pseudomonadota bacterium]|nr:ABC transporter ATP-binding protein [Pseudomonadota bacterium]